MRPTAIVICLMLAASTGCSSTVERTVPTTVPTAAIDLRDPATQRSLGSPEPAGVVWQRLAGDLTIVGLTAEAVPGEIELIRAALADIPAGLLSVAEPRLFVRAAEADTPENLAGAVTLTYGPDIYLLDRTFSTNGNTASRLDLAFAFAHELTHVAQWLSLEDGYVRRALDGQLPAIQLTAGSTMVREYASAVGWVDDSPDPDQPEWRLTEGTAPTSYGGTNPSEDLADSVALAATGRANWLDEARLSWIINWLNTTEAELSAGRPWVPIRAEEIVSATPLYDEDIAAGLAAARDSEHVEPHSFVLPSTDSAGLAGELEGELRRRGLQGDMAVVDGTSLPRHRGTFVRADGLTFMVELWETATGDDGNEMILTYVRIW